MLRLLDLIMQKLNLRGKAKMKNSCVFEALGFCYLDSLNLATECNSGARYYNLILDAALKEAGL